MSNWIAWSGNDEPCLDSPRVGRLDSIVVGRYGGAVMAGADKNEDVLFAMRSSDGNWELAALLDAHASVESAELIVRTLSEERAAIEKLLEERADAALPKLEAHLLALFLSESFRAECSTVRGECSCLIVCRMENYLWWLSVGDCMLFVIHPDLQKWGQSLLNQRNFFEWVGSVNTFDLPVPCYSAGRRELRQGHQVILLATDGGMESEGRFLPEMNMRLLASKTPAQLEDSVRAILERLHIEQTKDSTTLLAWIVNNPTAGRTPSDACGRT